MYTYFLKITPVFNLSLDLTTNSGEAIAEDPKPYEQLFLC